MTDSKKTRLPFSEPEDHDPKIGLKKMSGQKSMFDQKPRVSTPNEFSEKVQLAENKKTGYKQRAAELFVQFSKIMSDKTLVQNRNVFSVESEKEILRDMISLASDINNDPLEKDSEGSLSLIVYLLKTCLYQRDRLNELEFNLFSFIKKMDGNTLLNIINQEINKALDKKKPTE